MMTFNSVIDDDLQLCANMEDVHTCLRARGNTLNLDGIFEPLTEAGMILGFGRDDEMLQFRFKNGVVHNNKDGLVDTENEIDVILMKGVVPVFISCKNGIIPGDELYKLNTVAEQFGSEYARKVLVATDMGKAAKSRKYFLERARDMGIQIIEDVHKNGFGKLENILKTI